MEEKEIVINELGQGFVRRTSLTPITGVAPMLRQMAESFTVRLPPLTPDTFLVYDRNSFTGFRRISSLKLNCIWSARELEASEGSKTVISPTFGVSTDKAGINTNVYTWDVPEDMELFFVITDLEFHKEVKEADLNEDRSIEPVVNLGVYGTCGLLALDKTKGGIYRLPLPNVYQNGSLCTGSLTAIPGYPLATLDGMFGTWEANRWNSDLISYAEEKYLDLIRLDPNTGVTLAPKGGDWRDSCFRVSPSWIPERTLIAAFEGF